MDLDEPAPGTTPILWVGEEGKSERLTNPRDAEIADLRSNISGQVREMDRLAGKHHEALLARDHYKRLCAAACEFLRSPALHTLRVGDRRFTREELIDYLTDMDGGPT